MSRFELKLKKKRELIVTSIKEEIQAIRSGLIKNVINGYIVKGRVQDVVEVS